MTRAQPRKTVAGKCPTCGARTLRGTDDDGNTVVVTVTSLTAAQELRCHIDGIPTYRAKWQVGIDLQPRLASDLRIDPAGYSPGRVYPTHHCREEPTDGP